MEDHISRLTMAIWVNARYVSPPGVQQDHQCGEKYHLLAAAQQAIYNVREMQEVLLYATVT